MSDPKEMVSFLEDKAIIEQVDKMAQREGSNRSALLRRAVRMLLFSLPAVPIIGKDSEPGEIDRAA